MIWALYERQRNLTTMFDAVFGDEANTMACAIHTLPECGHIHLEQFLQNVTSTAWGGVPALYFFILQAVFKLHGATGTERLYSERLTEVVFGVLCIPIVYATCRQLDLRRRA